MASKEALRRTYLAALQRWPRDPLRPECQLQDVLSKRLSQSSRFPGAATSDSSSAGQVNAMVSLLEGRYARRYPVDGGAESGSVTGGVMTPRSNPTYYRDLMKDLEEVPTRTWVQRMGLKMKGMIRWQ